MAVDFDRLLNGPVVSTFGDDAGADYGHPAEPAFNLRGILTRDHVEVSFDASGAPVSSRRTTFFAALSAFPPGFIPASGDYILAGGGEYQVADIQPDGAGGLLLILGGRYDRWEPAP